MISTQSMQIRVVADGGDDSVKNGIKPIDPKLLQQILTAAEIAELRHAESIVIKWVGVDQERANQFLNDPFGTATLAGMKFSAALIEKVHSSRAKLAATK